MDKRTQKFQIHVSTKAKIAVRALIFSINRVPHGYRQCVRDLSDCWHFLTISYAGNIFLHDVFIASLSYIVSYSLACVCTIVPPKWPPD